MANYYLGVDMGGTLIKIAIVDDKANVIEEAVVNTDINASPKSVIENITEVFKKFKPDYDLGPSPRFKIAKENDSSENTPIFDVAESSVSGEDVTYSVDSEGVCRRGGQVVARYVKSINTEEGDWENDTEQRGKVMITVIMEAQVPGFTEVASYTQSLMVSVRQLQNLDSSDKFKGRNKHWRQHLEE